MKHYYGYGLSENYKIVSISMSREVLVRLMPNFNNPIMVGLSQGMYGYYKKKLKGLGFRPH